MERPGEIEWLRTSPRYSSAQTTMLPCVASGKIMRPNFLGGIFVWWSFRRHQNFSQTSRLPLFAPIQQLISRHVAIQANPFWRTSSFAPSHQFIPPEVDVGVERTGNKSERLLVATRHSFLPHAFGESGLGLGDIKPSFYFYFLFF